MEAAAPGSSGKDDFVPHASFIRPDGHDEDFEPIRRSTDEGVSALGQDGNAGAAEDEGKWFSRGVVSSGSGQGATRDQFDFECAAAVGNLNLMVEARLEILVGQFVQHRGVSPPPA